MELITLPVVAVWVVASIALNFICNKFLFAGAVGLK
jgi:hypothetical protein